MILYSKTKLTDFDALSQTNLLENHTLQHIPVELIYGCTSLPGVTRTIPLPPSV